MSSQQLRIGQVAADAGMRASSIRYYESVGVLPEPERVGGQRRYSPEILTRLRFIDVAQQAGFSLDEIRELLDGSERDQASERLRALAQRKLPDVEALISRAEAMKDWLQAADGCECPTLDMCALFGETAYT
jgi:MerR family redox-sensitive transcriptional activator SoxR